MPTRPPSPSLPLTTVRADIRQWTKQPGFLIDNRAAFEQTGVQRLAQAPAAAPAMSSTAEPGSLLLPAALPIPAAPVVRLPAGEPAEVAAARAQVVDWLSELRKLSAEVHQDGISPDGELNAFRKFDALAMPAIVAALNAEKPGLNLVYAHGFAEGDSLAADRTGFGSVDWDELVKGMRPGRLRVVLDNDAHGLALDISLVQVPGEARPRASVLMLNPMRSPDTIQDGVVAELADQLRLPPDWPLLVAEVPAQKSMRSCKIFALSMALKSDNDSFDALHEARLKGEPLPLKLSDIDAAAARSDESSSANETSSNDEGHSDSDADSVRSGERGGQHQRPAVLQARPPDPVILGQQVREAAQLVGPQFMKHAQSKTDTQTYIKDRGAQALEPVNKKQQTLLERHDAHRVARQPAPGSQSQATRNGGLEIYSASIELKRIAFLDKAIRHAATCDPTEVVALAAAMSTVNSRWKDRFAY